MRPNVLRGVLVSVAALWFGGCSALEDNGTHLAYAIEEAAGALRKSSATESIVHYTPLDGGTAGYYVEFTPSLGDDPKAPFKVWGSYLVVSGKRSGGTSYHNRFVFVPRRLYLQKASGATEVVLCKASERIEVVELR